MVLYVLEIAYKKIYTKTKKEQMHLLKNFEPPEKFENTWLEKLYNVARIGGIGSAIALPNRAEYNISYFQDKDNVIQLQYDTQKQMKEKGYNYNTFIIFL